MVDVGGLESFRAVISQTLCACRVPGGPCWVLGTPQEATPIWDLKTVVGPHPGEWRGTFPEPRARCCVLAHLSLTAVWGRWSSSRRETEAKSGQTACV